MTMQFRVTAGPLEGAARALGASAKTFVGHDLRNDIVIRDPSSRGIRIALSPTAEGVRAELLSGSIMLHGAEVEAPKSFLLPPLTPIGIGDNIVAIGDEGDAAWAGCERMSRALALQAPQGAVQAHDPWAGVYGWLRVGYRDLAKRSALLCMGFAVLLGGTAMATSGGIGQKIDHKTRLETALQTNGFGNLEVRTNVEGELVVDGFVRSDAQLTRVADVIEASGAKAMAQVESGEAVAREVEHVLRINGVNATTVYRGSGRVEAMDFEAPRTELAKLRRAVMDDVAAVETLILTPARLTEGAGTVLPHDPGKRVANVVGGENGYIVTDDGARYFAGATLPTGDQLVSVTTEAMVLERGGRRHTIEF